MMMVGNGPPSAGIQTSAESSTPSRIGVRTSNMRLTWVVWADAGAVAAARRTTAKVASARADPASSPTASNESRGDDRFLTSCASFGNRGGVLRAD